MAEIKLMVGIRATREKIYGALTTLPGLSGWWTVDTQGEAGKQGGMILFRFDGHGPDMAVVALSPLERVEWSCVRHADNAAEWVGTRLTFSLIEKGDQVIVRFTHSDWRDATDFLAFCSMKWATFLLSLREFVESGVGRPWPHDLQIT